MRVLLTHCPSQAVRWCGAWSRESDLGRGDPGSAADEGQWAHSSHGAVYGIDLPCVSVFKEGKKVRFGIYKFTKKNKRLKTLSPWVWNKNSVISFYIQAKQEIKTKSCFESRPCRLQNNMCCNWVSSPLVLLMKREKKYSSLTNLLWPHHSNEFHHHLSRTKNNSFNSGILCSP